MHQSLNGQSLEDMEADQAESIEELKRLQLQQDALLLGVFDNPSGKALLDFWKDNILMRPVFHDQGEMGARMNEGRNNFIRFIINTIDRAKEP